MIFCQAFCLKINAQYIPNTAYVYCSLHKQFSELLKIKFGGSCADCSQRNYLLFSIMVFIITPKTRILTNRYILFLSQ